MQPHSAKGHKWRRFSRKYGSLIFVSLVLLGIVAFVGFLIYMLSSPDFRVRW